jgi:hypothetical protein
MPPGAYLFLTRTTARDGPPLIARTHPRGDHEVDGAMRLDVLRLGVHDDSALHGLPLVSVTTSAVSWLSLTSGRADLTSCSSRDGTR